MIFNSLEDLEKDLIQKILNFIKCEKGYDLQQISSLIKTYLRELEIRNELYDYRVYLNTEFLLVCTQRIKDEKILEHDFIINIDDEIRKNKLNKLNKIIKNSLKVCYI